MNKKLLFGIMSLAALTACTSDDFESQEVAQKVSPIQFEVINGLDDAFTRASEKGNKVEWTAKDGDLFTLYHGCTLPNAGQNATYKAIAEEGKAAQLTTPSMILQGKAIMVWPADTAFSIPSGNALTVSIPASLPKEKWVNHMPYVSDVIDIQAYAGYSEAGPGIPTAYKTAGVGRKYKIFMRPMASQLNLMADYAGTDETLATLYKGDDPIDEIRVTSVDLESTTDPFTTKIPLNFTAANATDHTRWDGRVPNNVWSDVTGFGTPSSSAAKLTTEVLNGNDGCKFLILPQTITTATDKYVVVNTLYGKVTVKQGAGATLYSASDIADAWYRYRKAGSTPEAGETETTIKNATNDSVRYTSNIVDGMVQTIGNKGGTGGFSNYTATAKNPIVTGEPIGAAATRYVKVLLTKLDMSDLHIETDKQLRDAARVWQKMGLGDVTVYLDGGKKGNPANTFTISQTTIDKINEINAAAGGAKSFKVKPCDTHACTTILVTGGGAVRDLTFIKQSDGANKADVVLNADENWSWTANTVDSKKAIKVDATATGVKSITNNGTFEASTETATIAIYNNAGTPAQVTTIPFVNDGTWNINVGDLNVQFDVTNTGTVNISSGAEYHQDGTGNDFTNDALTLPKRFLTAGPEHIGLVNNTGVFACVNSGHINNYGLIEHLADDAKTYITTNNDGGTGFNAPFAPTNRIGRINLPYSNKDEENVSISNATATGFVSVTVSTADGAPANEKLNLTSVGDYVNYCIIKSGVSEIVAVDTKIKYVEFDAGTKEIMWNVATATYEGLIVFSPVNVKRGTTVNVNKSVYLKAKMYVGGTTNITSGKCNGYFGNTSSNFATLYLTY